MRSPTRGEILRAPLFHTPRNPFLETAALEAHWDGALFVADGRILACGDYGVVRSEHADAEVTDLRGGFLLPGLIDTHIHFPQLRILGGLGKELLEWLEQFALPEEARMADLSYLRRRSPVRARFGVTWDHNGSRLRCALRPGHGRLVRRGGAFGLANRKRHGAFRSESTRGIASNPRQSISRERRTNRPISPSRAVALRGDSALRSFNIGGDARSL